MAERDLPPIPSRSPMIDRNGYPTQVWYAWFRQLFFRVGGHDAKTNIELDIAAPGFVTTEMLADGAVTTPKLAADAVTAEKIAAGAVGNSELADNSVTNAKMADDAIGTAEIQDDAVTEANLADDAVSTDKIQDDAVTGDKIDDGTITLDKISAAGAEAGQVIKYDGLNVIWDSSGGGQSGGQIVTDGRGNTSLNISPVASDLIIEDSDTVKWRVRVTNNGELYTEEPTGLDANTPFKIQKPDSSYGQIGVNTDGILFVDDSPSATDIDNFFFLEAPDGVLWQLGINNGNEIFTLEHTGEDDQFSVVDSQGNIYWQIRALAGPIALQYMRVVTAAELATATPPPSVSGCLPMVFLDNGSNKRLVYYDGADWRYVHDNSAA